RRPRRRGAVVVGVVDRHAGVWGAFHRHVRDGAPGSALRHHTILPAGLVEEIADAAARSAVGVAAGAVTPSAFAVVTAVGVYGHIRAADAQDVHRHCGVAHDLRGRAGARVGTVVAAGGDEGDAGVPARGREVVV